MRAVIWLCKLHIFIGNKRVCVDPSTIGRPLGDSAAAQALGWWQNCQSDQRAGITGLFLSPVLFFRF